jgi:glycosyltransferase involved in cell wall biosynthesis
MLGQTQRRDTAVAPRYAETTGRDSGPEKRRLRVLLSAFSCAPSVGSEPGLSWGLARSLACHHDVWLLLDEHNRPCLEKALASETIDSKLKFLFVRLPRIFRLFYRSTWKGYFYYCVWQIAAYFTAKRLHYQIQFDIVHHVSYANSWLPVWLGCLRVPFVWNRGVRCTVPWRALQYFSWRSRGVEALRNLSVRLGSAVTDRLTARCAAAITTLDRAAVSAGDCRLLRIGCGGLTTQEFTSLLELPVPTAGVVRIATIGRLEGWKGQGFGVRAFAKLLKDHPECEYWLVGDGPERTWLEQLAKKLDCADRVRFLGRLPRSEVLSLLSNIDILLHPSLREAFGLAVLEGMAAGRAVVCVDAGSLPELVGEAGIVVAASPVDMLVDRLWRALRVVVADADFRGRLGRAARQRAQGFLWNDQACQLSALYQDLAETSRNGQEQIPIVPAFGQQKMAIQASPEARQRT